MNTPIVAEVTPEVVPRELKRPTKVRITLKRRTGETDYRLTSSHPLPNTASVRELLPTGKKSFVPVSWNAYNLEYVINSTRLTIKPRQWADLIAKATTIMLAQEAQIESELVAIEGGGYLALGNALCRLNVVDYLDTGEKALAALRRRVTEDSRNEARAIVNAAETTKAQIIMAAEDRRLKIQGEVAVVQDQLYALRREAAMIPPQWARRSVPLMFGSGDIKWGIEINISIKRFVNHFGIWHGRDVAPVSVMFWHTAGVPFHADNLTCAVISPHCGPSSCLQIGDADGLEINTITQYRGLKEKIERALEEANLNSLMWQYHQWHPSIQAMVPVKLRKALSDGDGYIAKNFDEPHAKDPLDFHATTPTSTPTATQPEEGENEDGNDDNAEQAGETDLVESQPPE